jgi:hypothetical protein
MRKRCLLFRGIPALFFLLVLFVIDSHAQVVITVTKIPTGTPADDTLYISGSFNKWVAKDPQMQLVKSSDGSYSITLPNPPKYFEYKFTRGNWDKVEGDRYGKNIPNRIYSKNSPSNVELTIQSWMDFQSIKIVVARLPANTQEETPIYMTGPFNDWNPADPSYKLERLENGTYQYLLQKQDTLVFKFTRGTLQSMEADAAGNPIAPHKLMLRKPDERTLIYNIDGWEDFADKKLYSVREVLTTACFIALFVTAGLFTIRNSRRENKLVMAILLLITMAISIRILLEHSYVYYKAPQLINLPLLLIFAIVPLVNSYASNLVHQYRSVCIH